MESNLFIAILLGIIYFIFPFVGMLLMALTAKSPDENPAY
jgi:putative Mn2+ efflux pump MntP